MRHAAAPSLPRGWAEHVDGEPIGPNRGSCGTAAFLGEPVVVADIATDPRWELYRDAALSHGLRACWSVPILSADRTVLGTFAFYYTKPREPTPRLLEIALHASRLATIAIQRYRHRIELDQEAERRMKQLSDRLQMATRGANIGVWSYDIRRDRTEWDDVMYALHGVRRENYVPTYADWRTRVHAEDIKRVEAALQGALRGTPFHRVEFRIVWPDGTLRYVEATAALQRGPDGQPAQFVGTNWDVTEAKLAAQALRRAKEEAEAATHAKSLFLANMSHEIRTPLNAILGYAQLLCREPSLDRNQRRYVEIIHSSGGHLFTLINDILEMSKIEAGRATLVRRAFDLRALLDDVELMFRGLASAKGLSLSFDSEAGLARAVEGDAGKVRQVLVNLLSNAIKFTSSGYVAVRARSHRTEDAHLAVSITVEDSGPGVATEDLERIFNMFDQSGTSTTSSGTGLGLAISRNYARLMGGDVTVESPRGRGSAFTFSFTARAAMTADVLPGDGALPVFLEARGPAPKVLVVDDVVTNRELMRDLLSRIGFDVRVAANGREALEAHDVWQPDLMLMDLRMPEMDGFEATRRLRAAHSRAVIVAISASGTVDTDRQALDAGADAFLRKPYRETELLAKIGEMLDVRYVYAEPLPESGPASVGAADGRRLSELLSALPRALVDQLRDTALEARAGRLLSLVEQVRQHSAEAALAIAGMAENYRYDLLLSALGQGGGAP